MATYIKTLKEDNGDITYPQTKGSAVLLDNGTDLETKLSQFVTAEDIASTSALTPPVQTNMIADRAVTSDKIDWSTLGGVWSQIVSTSKVTGPQEFTTKKGTKLILYRDNGGSRLGIVAGGENIKLIRGYWAARFDSITGDYGIGGLAVGSTAYTYISAKGDGTGAFASSGDRFTTVDNSNDYGAWASLGGTISGNKWATSCDFSAIRATGSTNVWNVRGKLMSEGSSSYLDFVSEITTYGSGYTPAIYQRTQNESNTHYVFNVLEVFEE